jgi:hypothetical protein
MLLAVSLVCRGYVDKLPYLPSRSQSFVPKRDIQHKRLLL